MSGVSYISEQADGKLIVVEKQPDWQRPNFGPNPVGIFVLHAPSTTFFSEAYRALGASEEYCVIPVTKEHFNELKLRSLLQ